MKERLKELPGALQKQILYRITLGAGFFLLALVTLAYFRDWYLCLPCFLLAGIFGISGGGLLFQGLKGSYVCVRGICRQIEVTGFHRRVKSVTIAWEQGTLKMPVRQRMGKLAAGDTVIVYLSVDTPVYERDSVYEISSYYALEIRNH